MKMIAFLLVILSGTTPSYSQQNEPKAIKVLSWNIFMLPGIVSKSSAALRAQAIGDALKYQDIDVIVFQEAFSSRSRKIIWRTLKTEFPYSVGPANQRVFSLKTNSGIWILSKHPVHFTKAITYKVRSGWDAFARKGALLIELTLDKDTVQIVGTHLQSSGAMWQKEEQCTELFERLLNPCSKVGIPQIICGDFNIDKSSAKKSYQSMLKKLNAIDDDSLQNIDFSYDYINNDINVGQRGTQNLVDYILTGNKGAWADVTGKSIRAIRKRWAPQHIDLSDHYGIVADIKFCPKRNIPSRDVSNNENVTINNGKSSTSVSLAEHVPKLFLTPEYQRVQIDKSYTSLAGGFLSMGINKNWEIGIGGYTLLGDYDPKLISNTRALSLSLKLAGLKFIYTPIQKAFARVSFPLQIGVGLARIDSSDRFNKYKNDDDKNVLWRGNYVLIQPGVNVERQLTTNSIFFVGLGYRMLLGTSNPHLGVASQERNINGLALTAGVKINLTRQVFKK